MGPTEAAENMTITPTPFVKRRYEVERLPPFTPEEWKSAWQMSRRREFWTHFLLIEKRYSAFRSGSWC